MFRPVSMLMPPRHPVMPKEAEYAYDKRWEVYPVKHREPYAFITGAVVTIYNEDEVDPTFNIPATFVDATLLK
jgi:hypothetical protein